MRLNVDPHVATLQWHTTPLFELGSSTARKAAGPLWLGCSVLPTSPSCASLRRSSRLLGEELWQAINDGGSPSRRVDLMNEDAARTRHTYRVVLTDDGRGVSRRIEFEAADPAAALFLLGRHSAGREASLLQDERPLGTLKLTRGGFWEFSGHSPDREQLQGRYRSSKRGWAKARF